MPRILIAGEGEIHKQEKRHFWAKHSRSDASQLHFWQKKKSSKVICQSVTFNKYILNIKTIVEYYINVVFILYISPG